MFTIEVAGAEALSAKLTALPAAVQAAMRAKATQLALRLQTHVVQDKLSGQVLQAKTGALRGSITSEVVGDGAAISARVFSSGDVKYAAIQEYGGRTPAHDIVPSKARALVFAVGGKVAFAAVVHHPGSQIPAHFYLHSALTDMAGQLTADLKSAAITAISGSIG